MASLLNMAYLENLSSNAVDNTNMYHCTDLLKENSVIKFYRENNYAIYNYSFFDIIDNPKSVNVVFFPSRKALITAQTFTSRANKNLWFNFASQKRIQNILNNNLYNNAKIDSLVRDIVTKNEKKRKFIYSHFVMPHYAYYFDSTGKRTKNKDLMDENKTVTQKRALHTSGVIKFWRRLKVR